MNKSYELLETKVTDTYIREALRRIREALKDLDKRSSEGTTSGDVANIINNLSVWKTINANALASTTTIIDQTPIGDFSGLKYIMVIKNLTTNKARSMTMTVNNENGVLSDIVSDRIGTGIDFDITAVNNAGVFELRILNNELNALVINMVKLSI